MLDLGQKVQSLGILSRQAVFPSNLEKHAPVKHHAVVIFFLKAVRRKLSLSF